jgi:hypothetical protein
MLAPAQHAHTLLDDAFTLLANPWLYWPVIAAVCGVAARQLRKVRRRTKKHTVARSVRGWQAAPAVIDVVSVSYHYDPDLKEYYVAALTYFYRHPELETGDYVREFPLKASAKQWVEQFKGRQVMVHVNPKNPAESVLLDSDLEGLETHQAPGAEVPAQHNQSLTPLDPLPTLQPRYRFLCSLGELLSIAGLAGSAVLFAVSVAGGGLKCPHWLLWTGGSMLAIAFLLILLVQSQFRGNRSARSALRTYRPWYTAWVRWSPEASAAAFGLLAIAERHRADLPAALQHWMARLDAHSPYIVGCLGFLLSASFFSAVQRSQEQVHLPASGT